MLVCAAVCQGLVLRAKRPDRKSSRVQHCGERQRTTTGKKVKENRMLLPISFEICSILFLSNFLLIVVGLWPSGRSQPRPPDGSHNKTYLGPSHRRIYRCKGKPAAGPKKRSFVNRPEPGPSMIKPRVPKAMENRHSASAQIIFHHVVLWTGQKIFYDWYFPAIYFHFPFAIHFTCGGKRDESKRDGRKK